MILLLLLTLSISSLFGLPATFGNPPSDPACDALRTVADSLTGARIYGSLCADSIPKTECTTASLEVLKNCLDGIHVDQDCLDRMHTNLTEVSMDDQDCFCGGLVKFSDMLTSVKALLCIEEDEVRAGMESFGSGRVKSSVTLEDIKKLNDQIKSLSTKIEELSLHGQWCAYQDRWSSAASVISYASSFFADSNINNNALNEGTGVFTAPRAGVYLVTFSYMGSNDPGELTFVYLYLNGAILGETQHYTRYSSAGSGRVESTSGRAVYQRLGAGDTLTLRTGIVTDEMYRIMFCVQFINN